MVLQQDVCPHCAYTYAGAGGLGLTFSGPQRQTVQCHDCRELTDLPYRADGAYRCAADPTHRVTPWRRDDGRCPRCDTPMEFDPSWPVLCVG